MNLLKICLKIQEFFLNLFFKKKYEKLINAGDKKSKTYVTGNTIMSFNSEVKKEVDKINELANTLLKDCISQPEKAFDYIENNGTRVIKAPYMDKILLFIGKQEGFVTPLEGANALFFSIMVNIFSDKKIRIGFKTEAVFAMRNLPPNIYFLAHQFHLWLGYKNGLPGYDSKTQAKFKQIWLYEDSELVEKLSLDDILSLKDAIARDNEAINFVKTFARNNVGAKSALESIKDGKTIDL